MSALPDTDTTRAAMLYLDDVKSSDKDMTRIAAVMLLEEQFGLYHVEADAVYKKWSKEKQA